MRNHRALNDYLGKKQERPASTGKNVRIRRNDDGTIGIILHQTEIVRHYVCGQYVLRTGGWFSATTRKYMEMYSTARISGPLRRGMGDLGACSWATNPHEGGPWMVGNIEFEEGMMLYPEGQPVDFTL